jgi:hypothetical protein
VLKHGLIGMDILYAKYVVAGEASIAGWLARAVVEPNGPGSIPGGSGFFSQPIRVFSTPPQSRGFNNPFSREGVWWAGSPIVKVLGKILL